MYPIQSPLGYGGIEIPVENFEYLSGRERYFSWVPASDGNIVDGAVWTGDDSGEMVNLLLICKIEIHFIRFVALCRTCVT